MSTLDWRGAAQVAVPAIATALGGPLAGVAATVIGRVLLGRPDSEATTVEEAQKAVAEATATPEGLARLREAEARLKELEAQLQISLGQQALDNTRDARAMQVATREPAVARIAYSTLVVAAGTLVLVLVGSYLLLTRPGVADLARSNIELSLAVMALLTTAVNWSLRAADMVLTFYFGSSLGSREKTQAVGAALEQAVRAAPAAAPWTPPPAPPAPSAAGTTADDLNARELGRIRGAG